MFLDEEMEPMDTSDTPWCWLYLADCGSWHKFEDDPYNPFNSVNLESYYRKNPRGVLSTLSSSCHTKIDFSAMSQTDLSTGKQRRLQRGANIEKSCSCFSAAPVFWEKVDLTCPYQLIPLNEVTPEYQCVAHYVKHDGLLDRPIVSISRIQNMDLWEIYCRKKKQIMRLQGISDVEEKRVFHGTDFKNVESICKYNFDLRLSGQHGHVYGKGIYFAKHATYADKFSRDSQEPLSLYGGETRGGHGVNTKIMFLARVMVGKSKAGQNNFLKPDHGCSENIHYSCVDSVNHPTIFVIFDPNQIYPEYLIQYR